MKQLIFVLLLIPAVLKAQEPRLGNLSPLLEKGGSTILAKNWKYKAGDNQDWANPDFDDSSWQMFTNANLYNKEVQEKAKKTNIVWFRKRIIIDSTTTQKLVLNIFQSGASEIYLDGELIHSLGKVSSNHDSIICINQSPVPLSFPMKIGKEQLLAVRVAVAKSTLPLFQRNYYEFLTIRVHKEDYAKEHLFVATDSLFDSNGILNLGNQIAWRFHAGDDLNWAKPNFNDSNWIFYRPSSLTEPIPNSLWSGYGWFRYRFAADSSAYAKTTQLYFETLGAAEVYLDGKLVQKCGTFSTEMKGEKYYHSANYCFPIILQHGESHVLAIRHSYHKDQTYKKLLGQYAGTFGFFIGLSTDYLNNITTARDKDALRELNILGTMLLLVVLLHLLLYMLFPADRSNLYITIMVFLLFLHVIVDWGALPFEPNILQIWFVRYIPHIVLFMAALSMIPLTLSSIFNQKPKLIHKILIWLFPVFALTNFILSGPNVNIPIAIAFVSGILFFSYGVLIQAWRNKQNGVWIIAGAFLCLILSTVTWILYSRFSQNYWLNLFDSVLFYLIYGSIPIGLTVFMANRFRDLYTHLEQKVHARTIELEQSLEDLKSTQTQLIQSEKMASLGVLTAGIAHEIQNPLNFVNNFSDVNKELLEELKEELAEGSRQLAAGSRQSVEEKLKSAEEIANDVIGNEEKINHHGKRAESIVKGMLLHSRGNSGHKELVDINALCDEFLRLSYHGFRAKDKSFNAEYKTEFDPNLPKINVVPQDIGRVLLNLINNAFYAVDKRAKETDPLTPEGGMKNDQIKYEPTVTVTTSHSLSFGEGRGEVRISIKDNGPGIPLEIKDKIFQPFFTTKPTGQGTGLGLSLAYDIVKAHGGELKVKTEEGVGTEFIIHLPIN